MSETQGEDWSELLFIEVEPKCCSHIFGRDQPKRYLVR
jgi:hypothetical protein